MTDPVDSTLPILKAIQADIADLKGVRDDIRVLKESVQRIDARIASMDNFMAGFHSTLNWQGGDLDEYRARLADLERRFNAEKPD